MSSPLFDHVFKTGEVNRSVSVGIALRDSGIEDALARAERVKADYVGKCLEAIKSFPQGAMITSESVREIAGDVPQEISPNCMAGILKRAAAQNLIVITDQRVHAKRASLHAAELRQWRRL